MDKELCKVKDSSEEVFRLQPPKLYMWSMLLNFYNKLYKIEHYKTDPTDHDQLIFIIFVQMNNAQLNLLQIRLGLISFFQLDLRMDF